MYVCKLFSPEAGLSSTCTTRLVHISVYQIKERSDVVCQVLSSLSQWPYGNTFHCTHRHKSAAHTTTKHPPTPNSSETVTAINGTEPSWELQILLQPKPGDNCYTTASIKHSHRHEQWVVELISIEQAFMHNNLPGYCNLSSSPPLSNFVLKFGRI